MTEQRRKNLPKLQIIEELVKNQSTKINKKTQTV